MQHVSPSRRRAGGLCLLAAMLVLPLASAFAPDANAAVLCQRKNKVKLRPTACKGKETQVQDLQQLGTNVDQVGSSVQQLGTDLGTQTSRLGAQTTRLDDLIGQLRIECTNAPELVKVESGDSFYFDNLECRGGCRTHDGNRTACEDAWAISDSGATSCFFFKNLCLPCADCGEESGACQNTCQVPLDVTCPNDPTRTVFAGGPRTEACQRFTTQQDCEKAFHANFNLEPTSCFWKGGQCRGCGPNNENNQDCTNTCRTVECADESRTTLKDCEDVGNDAVACAQTWNLDEDSGDVASCFFDDAAMECESCGFQNELRDRCDNVCR
jgi:hypothetical protein